MAVDRFKQDRQRARDAEDPTANLCVVATVDGDSRPHLRTIVLRDLEDELAIFINSTSPKWGHRDQGLAILTYWPSVQVQYRLAVRTEPIPQKIVADSWQQRPDPPKRMDWYYEKVSPQSSVAGTRESLLENLLQLDLAEPLSAPANARGLYLKPFEIERLDLTQDNGVHDRVLYEKHRGKWEVKTLVP